MASVIVTLKIMPESPETDLKVIEEKTKEILLSLLGETETRTEIVPIAFGLKSVNITYVADEKKGSTEPVEKAVAEIDGVNSVEVIDVRRAVG